MSVMSGQATSVWSGEFRFDQVVPGVPGRSSMSGQFIQVRLVNSIQVGQFRSVISGHAG